MTKTKDSKQLIQKVCILIFYILLSAIIYLMFLIPDAYCSEYIIYPGSDDLFKIFESAKSGDRILLKAGVYDVTPKREINVSNWLTRLHFENYTFVGKRWVRTISGLQSLINLYLLALGLFCVFGRPFEW